jgi:hypothetical protein
MAKKKTRHVRLLVDFINRDYYWAYDEMITHLRPLLLISQQNPRLIERLDFRPDLPRGAKGLIYLEIARLLQSGSSVLRRGVCKNDLFRWLADSRHSNLGASFQTIQDAVNKAIKNCI